MSALGFHGLAHYLPLGGGEPIYLYGEVPSWLARLPRKTRFVVRSRVLFGDDLAGVENAEHRFESAPGAGHGLTVSSWRWPLKVSSPERAILEVLDALPGHATINGLYKAEVIHKNDPWKGLDDVERLCLILATSIVEWVQ